MEDCWGGSCVFWATVMLSILHTSCFLNNWSCLYSQSAPPQTPFCGVLVSPPRAGGCGTGRAVISRCLLMSCVFPSLVRWLSTLWPNFWGMLPTCAIPCGTRLFLLNGCFFSLSFPAVVFLLVSDFKFHYVVSARQADFTFSSFFFFSLLFFSYSGLDSLSFTASHFPEISLLSQELNYLLFIPAYLSASINPLPVRDQDLSMYHLITIFGSFPNLSFSPFKVCYLFSPFYKLCHIPAFHLDNLSWTPGFMALLTPVPIFKSDIGERLWKASHFF